MKNIFLVDADDTLLDFHGASAIALRAAFEKNGVVWQEGYLTEFKKINGGLWEALERKELTRKELMERRFFIYLQHLGRTDLDGDAFNQCFLTHLATHPLYIEGAERFLQKLGKLGRVYIVTNGTAWIQKSRFELSKLPSYAEDVFVSDTIGHDKPAKEYTDYVVAHIPYFQRENAVWIGDSLSADVKAANAAGITSVWYNRYKKECVGEVKPDYIAEDFDGVLRILEQINSEFA